MTDKPDLLLDGYRRFREHRWPDLARRYGEIARGGQRPTTAVVACSDARLDPQAIFDAAPGDLFVIRNVAGLVPVYAPDGGCHGTSAALEYAVRVLKIRRLVLLGHVGCDGVHSMIHGPLPEARDFLMPWMDIAEPVLWPIPETLPGETTERAVERKVLELSSRNLRTFPWILDAERSGRLFIEAMEFDIRTGGIVTLI
jgi:carbonic anhydrase